MSLAFRIEEVETIDSTNEACRARAEDGATEGLVIRADRQTGGRGRRGKVWESPRGNLYCSILLRPRRAGHEAATLGFAAVAALGNVAALLLPQERRIGHKWPNDLLIDGHKTSGLLLEARSGADGGLAWLVMGLGVNIACHPRDMPYPATDLLEMGAKPTKPGELLEMFLSAFKPLLEAWTRNGFPAIAPAWLERAVGIGQEIEIRLDRENLGGRFHALDPDGALVLELPSGATRRIAAGEVFFPNLEPALAGG